MTYLCWFSCGITSSIACKLTLDKYGKDNCRVVYIETGASHDDNKRFISDCEKWYGVDIEIIRSDKFNNPLEVAKKELFNTPFGAPCTKYLKKQVRQEYQKQFKNPINVMGFEYSKKEMNRALRFTEQQDKNAYYPLIEHKFTKNQCAIMLEKQGIDIPEMYKLGYNNNNCIGCFKGGAGYWNKIRQDFPEVFNATADLEKQTGHTCLKRNGKQLYLCDLEETSGRHKDFEVEDCGLFCELEMNGLPILDKHKLEELLK